MCPTGAGAVHEPYWRWCSTCTLLVLMQYLYLTGYVIVLVLMQYLSDADQSCSEHVGMLGTTVWGEKETILLLPTQVYIAFRRLQTIKQI